MVNLSLEAAMATSAGQDSAGDLPAGDATRQAVFRMALEQYNRHLAFAIDVSQKCLATLLVFAGVVYSYYKFGDATKTPLSCTTMGLVAVISPLLIFMFVVMQRSYYQRCRLCYECMKEHQDSFRLRLVDLGILEPEYRWIIWRWSAVFLCIYVGILFELLSHRPADFPACLLR